MKIVEGSVDETRVEIGSVDENLKYPIAWFDNGHCKRSKTGFVLESKDGNAQSSGGYFPRLYTKVASSFSHTWNRIKI